jgi:hypothetical protein
LNSSLLALPELRTLNLSTKYYGDAFIKGDFPISNTSKLEVLDISNNRFSSGSLNNIAQLPQLVYLVTSRNHFSGTIPTFPTTLEVLNLGWMRLTGSIPRSIGELTGLRTLDVHSNALDGPLDRELFNALTKLESFYGSKNLFSGEIPPFPDSLQLLQIDHNNFSSVDAGICGALNLFPSRLHGPTWLNKSSCYSYPKLSKYGCCMASNPFLCEEELPDCVRDVCGGTCAGNCTGLSENLPTKECEAWKDFYDSTGGPVSGFSLQ